MTTTDLSAHAVLRPEDVLLDQADRAEIGGVTVRKGVVAAFLQNAIRWSDPATSAADREELAREIAGSVPALRALGVFRCSSSATRCCGS